MPDTSAVERLALADLLLLAARVFTLPSRGQLDALAVGREAIVALCDRTGDTAIRSRADAFARAVDDALARGTAGALADVLAEYGRLFEGGGACFIHEASYLRRDKGAVLGDIGAFAAAFGFTLRGGVHERLDHIACELELSAMLLSMGVCAELERRVEASAIAHDGWVGFIDGHLSEWAVPFAELTGLSTTLPLYREGAALLAAVLEAVCSRARISLVRGPAARQWQVDDQPQVTSCGTGTW